MPSDPAKLSSTQASFRIRLAAPVAPMIDAPVGAAFGDPYGVQAGASGFGARPLVTPQVVVPSAQIPALAGAGAAPRRKGRVTTVTWTGQAAPGDMAATRLLEAVRLTTVPAPAGAPGSGPIGPGSASAGGYGTAAPGDEIQPLHAVPRQAGPPPLPYEPVTRGWTPSGELPEVSATAGPADARHARYPGRRVDLGLVLLPLRVVLGSLSVYAGFSKLCDPVYFDGGERGSMMRWLSSLHPWKVAEPLLAFAMNHPVGAGLGVAFTEIVVGVLTVLGLWQRVAAGAAMALSAALLFTVSWRSVPVYDAPDLIFLAAWSPLLIAGAPFGSLDGRIALDAWRQYGPEAPQAVRRRVLRRSSVVAAVVVGLTLLVGSMLGAAVRTGGGTGPAPVKPPTDFGSPLWPGNGTGSSQSPTPSPSPSPSRSTSPSPSGKSSPSSSSTKGGKARSTKSGSTAGSSGGPGRSTSTRGTSSGGTGSGGSTPRPGSSAGLIGGVLGSAPLGGLTSLGMDRPTGPPATA
ncbi:DoxX family membrane protein [Kitasatospora sp. DSM 101779]|uniref:DoxX family membrane protein n=1 Tax=Kitasatospora sp. DSM 101779 TaxID=2853165 RepID=UPI0021DAEA2A|nr:DoxX family membrane protein [Kitasatospora sp. DSM 101779]